MEKHKCKLCWKSFVNGRALGGHMRSHMVNLPLPRKNPDEEHPGQPESASSSSSSDDDADDEGEKKFSMADPEFSSSVVLQDRESETESSKNPIRKRSRLIRKPGYISSLQPQLKQTKGEEVSEEKAKRKPRPSQVTESWTEQEPVSSVSNAATSEEDVAFCLMMLSRDKRGENEQEEEECELEGWRKKKKKKKCYKCEACNKVFKSYQALGGHRASHKRKRGEEEEEEGTMWKKRKHECGICERVFATGQALGGHKRSHAKPLIRRESLIDLNLPAPLDLEEDDDLLFPISYHSS